MREQKQILLAEDDDDDSLFFVNALKENPEPLEVIRSRHGIELMEQLDTDIEPSMLFLDMNMPRKNGTQCLKEIRLSGRHQLLPVIVFSTSSTVEIVRTMFDAGANAYIVKPNDFELWKTVLNRAVQTDWNKRRPRNLRDFLLAAK